VKTAGKQLPRFHVLSRGLSLPESRNKTCFVPKSGLTCVLAVSNVLTALIFSALVTLKRREIRQESSNQIDRSLKDLAILFCASLVYLPPFQSYASLKKLERLIHLRLLV